MRGRYQLILSCEHAGSEVPQNFRSLFEGASELLESHRGSDIGAYELAEQLAVRFGVPLFSQPVTRLLVDVNRSLYRRTLFSEVTRSLKTELKAHLLSDYYYPYRNSVEKEIAEQIKKGFCVIHISQHSFTPVFKGSVRNTDVGILYNPQRPQEKALAKLWKNELIKLESKLRVRFNYPYLGKPDGLPAHFRRKFSFDQYIGYEFEINQKIPLGNKLAWKRFKNLIADSLDQLLEKHSGMI